MAEPQSIPRPDELEAWYQLSEVRIDGDRIIYYGEPLIPEKRLYKELWPAFQEAGYELKLAHPSGETTGSIPANTLPAGTAAARGGSADGAGGTALVAIPSDTLASDGLPWTNIALFVATILSTLFVGAAGWYFVPLSEIAANPLAILQAWPFTAAVLGVLMTHELGHYTMGRYHDVTVSLPYVIPFVFPFGTLGAIIKMKSRMPNRKALFDIGVAGPIAGLVATVVVTAIGLSLGPVELPARVVEQSQSAEAIMFNNPPLMDLIAWLLGEPVVYSDPTLNPHPVIIGGWVGMFFTFLNLLPVGQLDGGHMVRAMVGRRQETIAALVPAVLFGIAGYLHYIRELSLNDSVGLWAFWGLFSLFIAYKGPATPADETPIGLPRLLVGLATFGLGLLCFMLVPIQVGG